MKKRLASNNGLKRSLGFFVLLMIFFSPTTTWAKVGDTFDDGVLMYKVTSEEDKEVTVWVYAGEEPTGDLVIPATVTNNDQEYSVTGIDKNAFRDCSGLTSVFIPSSVKTIGGGAFSGCSNLKGITIPKGVTTIGLYAFKECTSMEWVSIGRDVTRIERDAFKGCEKVEKVFCYATPDQLNWNDHGCDDFKSDGSTKCLVREDELAAFKAKWSKGYNSDINISFTDGLGLFDDGLLKYRIIDEDENTVAINGYVGEKPVGDLEIPGSTSKEYLAHMHFSLFDVISIDDAAFAGCTGLTSVTISYGVKSIGENAFSGCEGLTSVDIGKDVVNIGKDAFYGCENVTEIHCNSDPAKLTWDDDGCNDFKADGSTVCYVKDPKTWKAKFNGIVNVTFKMEADGVFAKDGLLYSLSDVKLNLVKLEGFEDPYNPPSEIVIPATVEYEGEEFSVVAIGTAAFYECKALTTVDFAENSKVTEIGTAAFYACENLSSINLPKGLKTIEDGAFYACENLSSINFPAGLKIIEEGAFAGCPKLESIDLPDGFVGFGEFAFAMCSGLKSINLPTSVEDICNYVFKGCSSLKSINLPANLTIIGTEAFSECTGLSSISFPDKLTYIQQAAFAGCTGLTDIIIPASVKVIDSNAFLGCTNITDVYCYADPAKLEWKDSDCNDFKADKATVCHVDKDKLADFKAKWSTGNTDTDINVTFERIYQKNDMAFEKDVVDTYYGTIDFEPALTNPHSLTVAYSSSNETVAAVNAQTGKVKIQKVGQAVITATFDDSNTDYKPGKVSYTLNVKSKTVKNPPVALEKTYYFYDGKAKTPAVSVLDGQTVIPASEYTVSYSNNVKVGTATVTITDKDGGNYTVSGSATFEIGLKGDANGDNKVDAADIVEMVNETKGQPSAKFKKNNADIDGNGQITDADITEVAKIILAKK